MYIYNIHFAKSIWLHFKNVLACDVCGNMYLNTSSLRNHKVTNFSMWRMWQYLFNYLWFKKSQGNSFIFCDLENLCRFYRDNKISPNH